MEPQTSRNYRSFGNKLSAEKEGLCIGPDVLKLPFERYKRGRLFVGCVYWNRMMGHFILEKSDTVFVIVSL